MEVIMVDSKVNHKNPVRIAGIPAKTWTAYLPNVK
jgi:hypothetical protein